MPRTDARPNSGADKLRKRVDELAQWLRKHFPTQWPVRVYLRSRVLVDGERVAGSFHRTPLGGTILLRRDRWDVISETLIHEWAHARAWPLGMNDDPSWAVAYCAIRERCCGYIDEDRRATNDSKE